MCKIKLLIENRKIGFENCTWYSHLEIFIFSRPKVIGNYRQYLLLRTDLLQKTVAFLLSHTYFCAPRRF